MTTSTALEVGRRRRRAPERARSAARDLIEGLNAQLAEGRTTRFPSPKYRDDPARFFRDVLGFEPWSRQREILEAVRDHPRVAVRSGHKLGKSMSAAGIALWWYCSWDDARVVMSSTTSRQVDQILWRELRMVRARSGRCVECKTADPDGRRITTPCDHSSLIEGDCGELARTGLKAVDFREVVGFTAREAEAVAGVSGARLLYLIDEASGVPNEIFEAIEGNRAGGARIVMFSNPTKTKGVFFDAFHSKARYWHTLHISSEESPNVAAGREVIPGLALASWIEEMADEWGVDSPFFKVRVRGEFPIGEDGKIFTVAAIGEAEARWHEMVESGRLFVGLDPAGPSGSGDESVFVWRRGRKMLGCLAHRGLTEEGHVARLLALLQEHRAPRERPVVVIDREGSVGARVYAELAARTEGRDAGFDLVALRASDRAIRQPQIYDRLRDELTANLEQWIRGGGAILEDTKLEAELHEPEWRQAANGRMKVTSKDDLRKALGRSPDRYDALALSVWEPLAFREPDEHRTHRGDDDDDDRAFGGRGGALDPYAARRTWEKNR